MMISWASSVSIHLATASAASVFTFLENSSATIITVEGITDTEYTFTGLTANCYTYRVKAITGSRTSKWSNRVTVSLDPTGIDIITLDALDGNTIVDVFTTSGQLIRKTTLANWSQSLPRGTYILRTKNAAFKLAR